MNKGFCFDNPIENAKEDILNRNVVAQKIIDKIKNTANANSSFALGISSEWGRGKTSFLNLIENGINGKERIIVHFNPWLNNDEKGIVKSFFDELGNELRKYNRELSRELQTYSEMLNSIGSTEISWFTKITTSIFSHGDLRNQFESINQAILSSGLQIVIFIDDLDRLYEGEILEVLRLIRNSANFSNAVFIVAYDRNYLISALSKANEYHPNFYLEKIFQIEIALPAFERSVIIKKLRESLIPHLDIAGIKELNEILNSCTQQHWYDKNPFNIHLLENLRDVNRFINSFVISYETLKGESVLIDLLNVELLRIKYLGVYNLLAKDYKNFLVAKEDFRKTACFLTLKRVKEGDKELNKTCLEEYLKTNYQDVGIQKNQIQDVQKYVYSVFPDYGIYDTVKQKMTSITNPISIDRYFHYNLLSSNLSEIEFSNYRLKSDDEFQAKIKDWIDKGLKSELSNRLEKIEYYYNKEDYERIIKAIFYYASLPSEDRNSGSIDFDASNLLQKLSYDKAKPFYSREEDFVDFVTEIFNNQNPPFSFISAFIDFIFDRSYSTWYFVLQEDFLVKCKLGYFTSYAKSITAIDRFFFWLFHYCNYKKWVENGCSSFRAEEVRSEEAKGVFKECALRLPESFIKNIIATNFRHPNDKGMFSVLNTLLRVWDDWSDFESFVFSLDEEKVRGLKEFKVFFSKCKEVNFEQYIEFDFKEINLSDALLFSN